MLASFPGPSPPRRGLIHTACACSKYSVIFSVKSFVHFLVRILWSTDILLTTQNTARVHMNIPGMKHAAASYYTLLVSHAARMT